MKEYKETNFFKNVKKTLIDLEMTFTELREKTTYKTDCGLRNALKKNKKKAVSQVEKILYQN
ncbi:hypothetical protein [Fusobacterium necrophorum]|nr:hypothetical protein [Fusobacterium necrophorum]KYM50452.1 hypothetical protein A2U11_01355 [Fusobacterium necrophorum subsp. funduliforme]KYM56213.1 hypothetical protein A2U17_00160 [Fusobacterium necrophorum subsp. funduliforme]MDK4475005.1 hypothetical protein [Fusobacterium necrophorum]MDK4477458.1 hypothetical protein [Fusobacterium necrophorum]